MFSIDCYFVVLAITLVDAFILSRLSAAENVICKDDKGLPVDWFIIYKLPKLNSQGSDGSELAYMDNNIPKWRLLKANVLQPNNPLGFTLKSIYTRKGNGSMYAIYNDQISPPWNGYQEYPEEMGHTKGVIHFDLNSGYWIVHSVPQFLLNNETYEYPKSGLGNGQTALCISLSYKFLDVVGELFLLNRPQFYDFILPQKFKDSNPNLTAALEGKYLDTKDLLVRQLTSLKGQKFNAFAKSAAYDDDLWTGVAASLRTDLVVESWRKVKPNLNSSCKSKYKVENVLGCGLLDYNFNSTQDHAKWAVSKKVKAWSKNGDVIIFRQNKSPTWSCVGDINRQVPQKSRGGGAVCMDHPNVALNFQGIVKRLESCTKKQL